VRNPFPVNAPSVTALPLPSDWQLVLDADCVMRLRELDPGGQGGLVARVIRTYAMSLAKLLEQLTQARAAGDAVALRHVAHTLKSSSASADIERRLRDLPGEDLAPQLDALAREGERVLAALRPAATG
jgi:HPt (histidine-containing phosphotransfer) domain-containing protein